MHFVAIASHGRVPRPRTLSGCWLGKGGGFALPLHPTRPGLHARGPVRGRCPCDLSQRAFVLLGTMTGAFLPLDPDRGFAPGPYPMALPSGHPPRALAPFGNYASEPSCSDTMTGGLCLLRPPRAANRSPREGARPLRHAGATGTRRGMTGAVKARQEPAIKMARSLS